MGGLWCDRGLSSNSRRGLSSQVGMSWVSKGPERRDGGYGSISSTDDKRGFKWLEVLSVPMEMPEGPGSICGAGLSRRHSSSGGMGSEHC